MIDFENKNINTASVKASSKCIACVGLATGQLYNPLRLAGHDHESVTQDPSKRTRRDLHYAKTAQRTICRRSASTKFFKQLFSALKVPKLPIQAHGLSPDQPIRRDPTCVQTTAWDQGDL